MRRRSQSGFTLIELLIVVAIIGILAAIAIMNYMNALQRARQKRTMSDMRTIAQAWEQRNADLGTYTPAGFTYPAVAVTYDTLLSALAPNYIENMPKNDGWGNPIEFAAEGRVYAIRSPGRDGVFSGTDYDYAATDSPDCDIVFSNGNFVTWPDDMQGD